MAEGERPERIVPLDIEAIVAKMARIPPRTVSNDDREKLGTLETDLKRVIYGQDAAIEELARTIKLSRAGLGSPDKPTGSFLFAGPTGVGKTELAKQLAATMGVEFLRFDMSEYMEKHTVSRLIGAPPGYVGFDQGGLLTDGVSKHPYSVVVLDEIEKAHPDLFNILLQVMDHATLTDNNGKKADFRNVVLIMTSNAGSREMEAAQIGFGGAGSGGFAGGKKALEKVFSPEFRNRLDATVFFRQAPLPRSSARSPRSLSTSSMASSPRSTSTSRLATQPSTGSPLTATTRSSVRGRWRVWSKRSSRSHSPTSFSLESSSTAARYEPMFATTAFTSKSSRAARRLRMTIWPSRRPRSQPSSSLERLPGRSDGPRACHWSTRRCFK